GDADHALLYFSGHGYLDDTGGFLVSRDFTDEDMGVSMSWLTREINKSDIEEITLILDCCHAGSAANLRPEDGKEEVAELRKNVTVLAASTQEGKANEKLGQGVFTNILLQGLNGAAADLAGHVTAASLYSMADSILSPWQQRPVFKSFVTQMSPLRSCLPQTPKGQMRQLVKPDFFEDTDRVLQLSPHDISADLESQPETVRFFSLLLAFHQAGLIECPNRQSLFEAALNNSTCELTLHGRYVHQLITSKRF
ncbi:MAG: caspase family protein, partial [Bacteroidota bacterium]